MKKETQCSHECVADICMKTCGKCNGEDVCEDYLMPDGACEVIKNMKKCSHEYFTDKCKKTCNICGNY